MMRPPRWPLAARFALGLAALPAGAAADVTVPILYLRQEVARPPVLSNLDAVPGDLGLAGAEVALEDNRTTGRFLKQDYGLEVVSVPPGGDFLAAARAGLSRAQLVLVDAPADDVLALADLPQAQGALLFNVAAEDARLRDVDCRANLLHTIPETAARTDALMQLLAARAWGRVVMVVGPNPADQALADSYRRSAAKFGLQIAAEKVWSFDTDLRESTLDEIPRFTQDFPDHDVLIVADATDDFGRYVEHNTWLPRVVAGSDGLVPQAWAPVVEAWGAVQLQNRFEAQAHRDMQGQDYAGWIAVRAIGEAVTRENTADPARLRAHLLDQRLVLDGFKGRGLSFRDWNGQLRQPIPIANDRALVAMAPLPGFLHQTDELDTLGLDRPESTCTAFGGPP